jgi:predicted nucleotidyltransferase
MSSMDISDLINESDRKIIRTSRRVDENLLSALVRLIVAASGASRVILFGSRARGQERADSDVDLLVVVTGRPEDRREKRRAISRALAERLVPIDILVRTEDEVREAALLGDPLIQSEIFSNGRALYAR